MFSVWKWHEIQTRTCNYSYELRHEQRIQTDQPGHLWKIPDGDSNMQFAAFCFWSSAQVQKNFWPQPIIYLHLWLLMPPSSFIQTYIVFQSGEVWYLWHVPGSLRPLELILVNIRLSRGITMLWDSDVNVRVEEVHPSIRREWFFKIKSNVHCKVGCSLINYIKQLWYTSLERHLT